MPPPSGASGGPPIPPGVTDVNHGPSILAVAWTECGIGLIFVALRMYTRARVVKNVGWDDWMMVLTAATALVTTALVNEEVRYGVGRHIYFVPPQDLQNALEMIWLTAPFSTFSACFGKISIALLLMRLMGRNKWRTAFLWFIIVSIFATTLALTIITFAQCTPAAYLWEQFTPGMQNAGSCWNPNIQLYYGTFQAAYAAFTDLVLALFPLTFLWTLQINIRLKVGLAVLLGMGLLCSAAAAIKTSELHNLSNPDFTWAPITLIYWYVTENWVIVIAACIPTLPPLLSRKLGIISNRPEWTGAQGDTSGTATSGGSKPFSKRSFNPFRTGHRPLDSIDPTVTHDWDLEKNLRDEGEVDIRDPGARTNYASGPLDDIPLGGDGSLDDEPRKSDVSDIRKSDVSGSYTSGSPEMGSSEISAPTPAHARF